jgi:hypothetical protein
MPPSTLWNVILFEKTKDRCSDTFSLISVYLFFIPAIRCQLRRFTDGPIPFLASDGVQI